MPKDKKKKKPLDQKYREWEKWLDRAKEAGVVDPDPNVRMCQAFAHFDGPGWTKFNMAALIIELSEKLDKLEDKNDDDFYKQWNARSN